MTTRRGVAAIGRGADRRALHAHPARHGLSLVGTVLGAEDGAPVRIEYRVLTDAEGLTTAAHVRDLRGFDQRTLTLERDARATGRWTARRSGD